MQRGLSLRRGIPRSHCDTSGAAVPRLWIEQKADIEAKTPKMKAVILAYCKQRQISTVYYFGLLVSEKCERNRLAYGEYGQFGYKVDARRASGAAALRHKTRVARGRRAHQQLPGANFGSIAAEIAHRRVSGSAEGTRSAADATAVENAATAV